MPSSVSYVYAVEREQEDPSHVRVALVRRCEREVRTLLRRRVEISDRTVIFHRTFRPIVELAALERYAGQLGVVARYANRGTFGCFVESRPDDGEVNVCLYERWFDGQELHTEELARRAFDATDEASLVASAEFVAHLEDWAERRNDQHDAAYRRELDDQRAQRERAAERQSASLELAEILAAYTGRS
jgi:hypothetical protein